MSKNILPPRSTGLIIFESVASIALVVLSVVGNIFIFVALYRNPRLRNSTNIYIAALAITDIMNACIPGTLFASTLVSGRMVLSLPVCLLSGFMVHFLAYVSMITMTLTAVNRYFRVVKPQYYNSLFGGKRSLLMLGCLWLLVASFVLYPTVAGVGRFSFNPAITICAYRFTSPMAETVFTLIVVFVVVLFCLLLVCFSYYHVSKTIREHKSGAHSSLRGVSAQEINLSKVLFVLVLAFVICWLPTFAIILVIRVILKKAPHELAVMIPFLFQITSVLNPLLYGALSPPFKREFRKLLTFQRNVHVSDQGLTSAPPLPLDYISTQSSKSSSNNRCNYNQNGHHFL
ncbi:melatonin receptor type 1A-like [Acropora millepora]|uniref:melatonin receptor type 1A-like n=1 Tax=Acropora millepora TaxID=45264 RepID=UPI001CF4C592|nr:melatonin receptor type 1A-like [Acropora millepora]